eukprot:gene9088-biopygen14998
MTNLRVSNTQTSAGGDPQLAPNHSSLCPRFGQVRVFRMRARDVPGHLRMVLSGLVPCSVARGRRSPWRLGVNRNEKPHPCPLEGRSSVIRSILVTDIRSKQIGGVGKPYDLERKGGTASIPARFRK